MIKMLRIDLEKMFGNYRFYIAIAGIICGMCLYALDDVAKGVGRAGVEDAAFSAFNGSMFLLILMLSVVGGGFSFCEEQNKGNIRFITLRSGIKKYVTSKVSCAFIGGYLVTFFGQLFSIVGLMAIVYYKYHGTIKLFAGAYETVDMLQGIIGLSFLGAIMSVIGLTITTILPNYFVGMSTPILIYYLWTSLDAWFDFPPFLKPAYIYFETQKSVGISGWWYALIYNIVFNCLVSYFLYGICVTMVKRRVEND